jgi:hypothetical protein
MKTFQEIFQIADAMIQGLTVQSNLN